MRINSSHPAFDFISSVLDSPWAEAIIKAAADAAGTAACASGEGAVAALAGKGAAAFVGYAIGRSAAIKGGTGHTRGNAGNNDVAVGVYHGSNSVATGQQQQHSTGRRGDGDDQAPLTGREEPQQEEVQVAWAHVGLLARHVGELSTQHTEELREKELANGHVWMEGKELEAELTSTRENNAQMRDWISAATKQLDIVRHNLLVGREDASPLRTEEELAERVGQLRDSEYQLASLKDELVRRSGDGDETAIMIRHAEEMGSLQLELDEAGTTNSEVHQLREDAKEHEEQLRLALTGRRSFLQDEVSRLGWENHGLRDKLTKAKTQWMEVILSRDYYQRLSEEKAEREGAEFGNALARAARVEHSAGAEAEAGEEDLTGVSSRAAIATIASQAKATTAVKVIHNQELNTALERAIDANCSSLEDANSRAAQATVAAGAAAETAVEAICNELSAALRRATKAESALTAMNLREKTATAAQENMRAMIEAVAAAVDGEAASCQALPVTANAPTDTPCRGEEGDGKGELVSPNECATLVATSSPVAAPAVAPSTLAPTVAPTIAVAPAPTVATVLKEKEAEAVSADYALDDFSDAEATGLAQVDGKEGFDSDANSSGGERVHGGEWEREASETDRPVAAPQLSNKAPHIGNASSARWRLGATNARTTDGDSMTGGATSHGLSQGAREASTRGIGSSQRGTAAQPPPGSRQGEWRRHQMYRVGHGAAMRGSPPPLHQEMPHHGMLHHGMPQHEMPYHGMPHHGIPHHGMPQHGMPQHGMSHHGMPHDGIPHHGMPQYGMPHDGMPHHGMPHHGMPHHGMPHHGMPHHGMPHQGMPHHGTPHQGLSHHDMTWHHNNEAAVLGGGSPTPRHFAFPRHDGRLPSQECFYQTAAAVMRPGGGNMPGGHDASGSETSLDVEGRAAAGSGQEGDPTTSGLRTRKARRAGKKRKKRVGPNLPI